MPLAHVLNHLDIVQCLAGAYARAGREDRGPLGCETGSVWDPAGQAIADVGRGKQGDGQGRALVARNS